MPATTHCLRFSALASTACAVVFAAFLSACGGDPTVNVGDPLASNPPPNIQSEVMGDSRNPNVVIRWEAVEGVEYYALYRSLAGDNLFFDPHQAPNGEVIALANDKGDAVSETGGGCGAPLSMDKGLTFSYTDDDAILDSSQAYTYDIRMCVEYVPPEGCEVCAETETIMIDGKGTVCVGSRTGQSAVGIGQHLNGGGPGTGTAPPNIQLAAMGTEQDPRVIVKWERVESADYYALHRYQIGDGESFEFDASKKPRGARIAAAEKMGFAVNETGADPGGARLSMDAGRTFSYTDDDGSLDAAEAYEYDIRLCEEYTPPEGCAPGARPETVRINGKDAICMGTATGGKLIAIGQNLSENGQQ